jgi:hypothetical protein
MIIGSIAAGMRPAGTVASGSPFGNAVLAMDFRNGLYYIGNTAMLVSDLIDVTSTIDASGLLCDYNALLPPINLLATATAAIPAAGWSLIIEWIDVEEVWGGTVFSLQDGASGFHWAQQGNLDVEVFDQSSGGNDRSLTVTVPAQLSGPPRKIGVTRTASRFAVCANGGTVQTSEVAASMPTFNDMALGGYIGDTYFNSNLYIRNVIFYPALSDALLQTNTTV